MFREFFRVFQNNSQTLFLVCYHIQLKILYLSICFCPTHRKAVVLIRFLLQTVLYSIIGLMRLCCVDFLLPASFNSLQLIQISRLILRSHLRFCPIQCRTSESYFYCIQGPYTTTILLDCLHLEHLRLLRFEQ